MATRSVKYLDATYPTLNSALAVANDGDVISIEGTWGADDTTACTISDSVDIITDSSSKCPITPHDGTGTWYRHRVSSGHAFTINASKTITFEGVDIQNKSTGTSDECFRITGGSTVTLTLTRSLIGFGTRNDQQDGIYADSGETVTLNFNSSIFYNMYRGGVDLYQAEDASVVNFNSCSAYNMGNSSSGSSRSGLFGCLRATSKYPDVNIHNCYIHTNTGYPVTVSGPIPEIHITNSECSYTSFSNQTLDTDTGNTVSVPAVDSSPSPGEAYFEDVTTSPYNLTIKDHANNALQDQHAVGTSLGMTIPSTDFVGTSRPQNTDYDIGAFEIAVGGGGGGGEGAAMYHHLQNLGVY